MRRPNGQTYSGFYERGKQQGTWVSMSVALEVLEKHEYDKGRRVE